MNKQTWYNITPAVDDSTSAEVSIYDAIGGYDINAKQFAEELKGIEAETIHLRINSPGGSVVDGNAIFNALNRHDAKIITHIDGLAASMASVVAMVGDEVHMADNALMMIHNPWTITMGDADDLRADAELLDKMSNSIINAYSRSQYEPEEIKDLMDAETWFTAQEALDAGLIDHIENGLRAAASDIAALAEGSELHVPAEKQIVSLSKQLEAVAKASEQISGELAEQIVVNQELQAKVEEVEQAKAEAEANAEKLAAEVEEQAAEIEAQAAKLESKEAEVDEAKDVTNSAVAAKAAEIVQSATVEPVAEISDEAETKLSSDEFWAEYHSISDLAKRNVWYAENKHRKI